MVEVGPFCGRSSWCWSKSVVPNVAITCIDIWDPVEHPYSPPAKSGMDAVSGEDFGKASTHPESWGTRENFDYYTRDCHNITAAQCGGGGLLGTLRASNPIGASPA